MDPFFENSKEIDEMKNVKLSNEDPSAHINLIKHPDINTSSLELLDENNSVETLAKETLIEDQSLKLDNKHHLSSNNLSKSENTEPTHLVELTNAQLSHISLVNVQSKNLAEANSKNLSKLNDNCSNTSTQITQNSNNNHISSVNPSSIIQFANLNQQDHQSNHQVIINDLENNSINLVGGGSQHHLVDISSAQVVVVDPNQLDTVVVVNAPTNSNQSNDVTLIQNANICNLVASSNSDSTSILLDPSAVDSSVIVSNSLALDDDSNQMDEDQNEASLKEIDDTLAMSPGFGGGGLGSFTMNGNNVSTHTFRKTEWDVKKLENYVRLSFGDATPMENMQPSLMNRYLKSFFELAKKSDGMDYEPESLIGFMNSFERYLKTKNYPESLLRSETFKESRTVLKKKRDLVRSIGKLIRTKTKDTCYLLQFHRNLLKDKGLLNRDNPDCLLAEIYLNNMIFFGEFLKEDKAWRGNLNLVWGDMLLERDSQNGVEYLTLATYAKKSSRSQQHQSGVVKVNTRTKTGTQTSKLRAVAAAAAAAAANNSNIIGGSPNSNNLGCIDLNSPRVYARQPASWCPIEAYKMYRSRRPNNCLDRDSPFYLAPLFKSKNQSKIWYKALAMSCQRLDALFYCLFKKAGVDLTSLASMSQQQQQQAVAAAASIINSNETISNTGSNLGVNTTGIISNNSSAQLINQNSSLAQWKTSLKDANQSDEVNELIANGSVKNLGETSIYHISTNQVASTNNTANFYQNSQHGGSHHIVTTVPAQVQVQVQVQVQPQHHQQTLISGNNIVGVVTSNSNLNSNSNAPTLLV